MKALLICGICGVFFSETAAAEDRTQCLIDCGQIYFNCRMQCPGAGSESNTCAEKCVDHDNECKRQCNCRYPNPLLPPPTNC
jgi:hypothetical protein